jgi:hypothetical protein
MKFILVSILYLTVTSAQAATFRATIRDWSFDFSKSGVIVWNMLPKELPEVGTLFPNSNNDFEAQVTNEEKDRFQYFILGEKLKGNWPLIKNATSHLISSRPIRIRSCTNVCYGRDRGPQCTECEYYDGFKEIMEIEFLNIKFLREAEGRL